MDFDALSFCKDNSVPYWTEGKNVKPGWIGIQCPLCGDHSNHGGFNVKGGYYSCWKCGGSAIQWVISKLLKVSKQRAEAIVLEYSGRGSLLSALNSKKKSTVSSIKMPGDPLGPMHQKYLKKRGFDPDFIAKKYGVLGTGISGDWKYRLMVPIYLDGKLVSYQGRDITGKQEHRYMTLSVEKSVVNPKEILYNLDNCIGDTICVVEGVFDVFRMGDGFAATLGTSLKETQIKLLSKYRRVLFLFDPEEEAQEKARKAASKLGSLGISVELIDLEMDADPGDLSVEQALQIRKELGV